MTTLRDNRARLLWFNAIAAALGWCYATTFAAVAQRWIDTPEYSHGWVIPLFSLWFVARTPPKPIRWDFATIGGGAAMATGLYLFSLGAPLNGYDAWTSTAAAILTACGAATCVARWMTPGEPSPVWLSWLAIACGLSLRMVGTYLFVDWLDAFSIVPVLWGLLTLVYGRAGQTFLGLGFLAFAIPLPFSVETALREPLRKVATLASVYVLQTLGFPTVAEGYVIVVGSSQVGVTEACSGLSMLMVFATLTAAIVLLIPRPWWYRGILCLSWPVIAVLANVFRIALTGALHFAGWDQLAEITFHDLAGLAMMPVGMLLLWFEMAYLDRLFVLETERRVTPFLLGIPDSTPAKAASAS